MLIECLFVRERRSLKKQNYHLRLTTEEMSRRRNFSGLETFRTWEGHLRNSKQTCCSWTGRDITARQKHFQRYQSMEFFQNRRLLPDCLLPLLKWSLKSKRTGCRSTETSEYSDSKAKNK